MNSFMMTVRRASLIRVSLVGILASACADGNPGAPTAGSTGIGGGGGGGTAGTPAMVPPSTGLTPGSGGVAGVGGQLSGAGTSTGGIAGTGGNAPTAGLAGGGGAGGTAGAPAAGAGGGTSSCAGKGYAFCEGFESGTVAGIPTDWTALKGFGTPEGVGLANDDAHSGSMSLKSDSSTPGQSRVAKSLAALGATATVHYGRIFYKVKSPAPKPNGGVVHLTLTALLGTTENRIVDTVESSNGSHQFLFNLPDDSCCTSSAYDYHFDGQWHCAEWHVSVPAQSYQFWIDGTEVRSLAFSGRANARMSNYTSIAVGAIFYQRPPSPFVVWFDDLAIDDQRVGCN